MSTTRRLLLASFLVYFLYLWPVPAAMTLRQLYFARTCSEGHLGVDGYARRAGDVVAIGSHVYSVAPPLPGILGAPVIAATKLTGFVSREPGPWSQKDEVLALIPFTAFVSALALACAVALVHRGLRARGRGEREALLAALAFGLATPVFPYATLAYDEALACALVVLGIVALTENAFFLAGLGLGLSVLASYHCTWAAVSLGVAVIVGAGLRPALRLGLGALPPFLLLLAFNLATTGNFLEGPGARFTIDGEAIGRTPWHFPSPNAFFHLTVGPWKGMFFYWPLLAVGAFGLAIEAREDRWLPRALLFGAAAVFLGNAAISTRGTTSWASWESFGPRHSLFAVPFLAFGIPTGFSRVPRALRAPIVLVSFVSAWAGAQTSWQFSVHEAWLELFGLAPHLRGAAIVAAVLRPGGDAEAAGVVAALVLAPLVGGVALLVLRPSLPRSRWLAVWVVASLLHTALALPWFLFGRGHEDELRQAAARRSLVRGAAVTDSGMRLVYVAHDLFLAGDRSEALSILERAVALEPANPDVLSGAVRIFRQMDDHTREGTLAVKLHAIRPDDVEVAITVADSVWARGDHETARQLWRAILAARPDVADRPELKAHLAGLALPLRGR